MSTTPLVCFVLTPFGACGRASRHVEGLEALYGVTAENYKLSGSGLRRVVSL